MYAKVVVGIDGLPGGRDAAVLAESLAPATVSISLAHVRVVAALQSRGSPAAFDVAAHERSNQILERELAARASVVDAEVISVLAASVGAGLHDVAESRGADLIVVGSCHRSVVGRVLAGNDTRSALHHAPCAVAVAPAGYADRSGSVETIAVAYDGSGESEVALAHAVLLAEDLGAKLIVRHFVEPQVFGGAAWTPSAVAVEDPETAAAVARARLGDLDGVKLEVIVGPVRQALVALSQEVDVLVCGSRHQGAGRRVVLGSTSDYLARHSACPFLVTPATDQQRVAAGDELRDMTIVP